MSNGANNSLRAVKFIDQMCDLEQGVLGFVSASLGLLALHAILGQFGASGSVITALLISTLMAVIIASLLSAIPWFKKVTYLNNQGIMNTLILMIAAVLVTISSGFSLINMLTSSFIPAEFLQSNLGMTLALLFPCLLCWSGSLSLLVSEFAQLNQQQQRTRLMWCGLSCCLLPVTFFPYLGILNTAYITLTICSLLVVSRIYAYWLRPASIINSAELSEIKVIPTTSTGFYQEVMVIAGLIGLMTVAIRYFSNLILASEMLPYVELGCLFCGCSLSMIFSKYLPTSTRSVVAKSIVGMGGPGLAGLMLLLFPVFMHFILWSTTYLQLLPLIVLSKFAVIITFYLPMGCLLGFSCMNIFPSAQLKKLWLTINISRIIICLMCICMSIWLTRFICIANLGVAKTFTFWSAWIMIWSVQPLGEMFSNLWRENWVRPKEVKLSTWSMLAPRLQLCLCLATAGIILLQPITQRLYQPELSAQLLFSGISFGAYREQVPLRDIPQIEGNRPLIMAEGAHTTLTAFTFRNAQLQLRKSGTPSTIVSRDPDICPHFSGDMLATILPLVIHEAPRNISIIGAAGGASAKVAATWPLHTALIIDPDNPFIQQLGERGIVPWYPAVKQQPNLKFSNCDLPLAYCQLPVEQDVIVVNTDISALASTAPCYTEAYLKQVQTHLSPTGIFALRLNYTDYGAKPIVDMAATFCKLYADAIMIEAAPGEMVFIGCQKKDVLTSSVIIQNLQTIQARRLIAEIGWDWTIILNLSLYEYSNLKQLAASNQHSHQLDNLAFKHPLELYGWHQKRLEVSKLLEKKAGRLLAIHEQHPLKDDILYRLTDISAREKLLYDHPDEPWAYRKFAKERLQNHTRSEVITVKGEGLKKKIHPDDQRRLDYFESLGQLLQDQNPTLEDIQLMYQYKEPYDPVISYFMHNEIARICARLDPAEQVTELRSRMHMIFFGSLNDRSVMDICKCLMLLTEIPRGDISDTKRWEYANGLCEQLKIRWKARASGASVPPVIEISDLKESIAAVRLVTEKLPIWGQAAGIDQPIIDSRIRMLDKLLISSLQDYKLDRIRKLEESRQSTTTPESTKQQANPIYGF